MSTTFLPEPYFPSSLVTGLHGIVRVKGNNTIGLNAEYAQGVAATGVVFFLPAVLLLLGFIFCALCDVCASCCCKKKVEEAAAKAAAKSDKCKKFILFLFTGIGLLACFLSLGYTAGTTRAVNLANDQISNLGGLLDETSDIVASFKQNTLETLTSLQAVNCPIAQSEVDAAESSLQLLFPIIDDFNLAVGNLSTSLAQVGTLVADYNSKRDSGYVAGALITAGSIVLTFILSCCCASCEHAGGFKSFCRTCSMLIVRPVAIIMMVFLLILCGLTMILSVIVSDICINPDAILLDLSESFLGSNTTQTLGYIMDCSGLNPIVVPVDDLITQQNTSIDYAMDLRDISTLACPSEYNDLNATVMNMNQAMNDLVDGKNVVKCASLNPIYTDFVHNAYCSSLPSNMMGGLACSFVASFSLLILLTCVSHGTDKKDQETSRTSV